MRYIVSYDITSDRKRKKVSDILSNYGVRMQYSVFECFLKQKDINIVKVKLANLINIKSDSVMFIPVCENCNEKRDSVGKYYEIKTLKVLVT